MHPIARRPGCGEIYGGRPLKKMSVADQASQIHSYCQGSGSLSMNLTVRLEEFRIVTQQVSALRGEYKACVC